MMQATETLNIKSLLTMKDEIKSTSDNSCFIHNQAQLSTNTFQNQSNLEKTKEEIIFPLLRLPMDIIKNNVSFFLNEKDIFEFEQCCRLFYQMINISSYLKQSHNFKTFTITNYQLHKW